MFYNIFFVIFLPGKVSRRKSGRGVGSCRLGCILVPTQEFGCCPCKLQKPIDNSLDNNDSDWIHAVL